MEPELAFRGGLRLRLRSRFVAEVRHSFSATARAASCPWHPPVSGFHASLAADVFPQIELRPADLGTINGGGHGRPSEETSNGRCCRACRWNRLVPAQPVSVQSGCKPASLEDRPGASRGGTAWKPSRQTASSRQSHPPCPEIHVDVELGRHSGTVLADVEAVVAKQDCDPALGLCGWTAGATGRNRRNRPDQGSRRILVRRLP